MNEDEQGAVKSEPKVFYTRHCKHNDGEYSLTITCPVRHSQFMTHGKTNDLTLYELTPADVEALAMALFKEAAQVLVADAKED